MKKLFFAIICSAFMFGCKEVKTSTLESSMLRNVFVKQIDKHEYIVFEVYGGVSAIHKVDCRYCEEHAK